MIKKIVTIIFLMTNLLLFSELIEYKDKDALLSFKYPSDFKFYKLNLNENNIEENYYTLYYFVFKMTDLKQNNPSDYEENKKNLIKFYENIKKGNLSDKVDPYSINQKIIKIGKLNILTFDKLSENDNNIIEFNRDVIFFNNGYFIGIILSAGALIDKIKEGMPKYFKNSPDVKWKNNTTIFFNKFINTLKNKKGCKEAQIWYDSFNEIIKSIEVDVKDINPFEINDTIKYYKPSITNLLFREEEGRKGKIIRMFLKDEKLEFIEKGEDEIIDGIKGNWIKVRTEKDEIGWCFDGYLEEMK